jgi:Protein of unknown function (DUF3237)
MTAAGPANCLAKVELEHICSYWATLTPPEVIGPVGEDIRANVYVTAGEVSGPKMRGRIRPVGGDWLLIRPDGVGVLDVRATMELDNGALTNLYDISWRGGSGSRRLQALCAGNPAGSGRSANRAAVPYQPS